MILRRVGLGYQLEFVDSHIPDLKLEKGRGEEEEKGTRGLPCMRLNGDREISICRRDP